MARNDFQQRARQQTYGRERTWHACLHRLGQIARRASQPSKNSDGCGTPVMKLMLHFMKCGIYALIVLAITGLPRIAVAQPVYVSDPPPGSIIDFGDVPLGSVSPQIDANGLRGVHVTRITNDGDENLSVVLVQANVTGPNASDFLVPNFPGGTIVRPFNHAVIPVALFRPSRLGRATATWTITSNDPALPVAVYVFIGNGIPVTTPTFTELGAVASILLFAVAGVSRLRSGA